MRHGVPSDPLLRGARWFFGWVGGGLQASSCSWALGLCIFALPQILNPGWGYHKPATASSSFALGFALWGIKQKENGNASGWIEIKKTTPTFLTPVAALVPWLPFPW